MDYRIITIGSLSKHELWDEKTPVREPHATTVLVQSGDQVIVIDPGLPARVIGRRLTERSGIKPEAVTDVFLTNFRPSHRQGISAFPKANWLISEMEREAIGQNLVQLFQQTDEPDAKKLIEREVALLQKCKPAPDRLAPQVDLFPLPGFTPGNCGLLLLHMNSTTLVAGDAVATSEHLEHGRILAGGYDPDQARESFAEALEIADVIIPGHDNVMLNPARRTI